MMSRFNRRERRIIDTPIMKINGKRIDIYTARIVYKCAECFGDLERHNFGLRCKENHEHRFFVHRDEIAELQKQQSKNIDELKEVYEIVDGKVMIK